MRILIHLDAREEPLRYNFSFGGQKSYTNRRGNLQSFASRSQPASRGVNTKFHDCVGKLILCQQKMPGRINRKIPRLFAAGWQLGDSLQPSGRLVDFEYGYAVVASI